MFLLWGWLENGGETGPLPIDGIPTTVTIGWVAGLCLLVVTGGFTIILRWIFFTHLPEKEKQFRELMLAAEKDRIDVRKELIGIMAAAEAERVRDREMRHQLGNSFQAAMSELLTKHDADAEKDRLAFMQRTIAEAESSRERNTVLKDAIQAQTIAFKEALGLAQTAFRDGLDRVAISMEGMCEASNYFPGQRGRRPPNDLPKGG